MKTISPAESPATPGSSFQELAWLFSRTGTRLLAAGEEKALAEQLWRSRRRLRLALVWGEGRKSRRLPAEPSAHRRELPVGLRKRLLKAESTARSIVLGQRRLSREGLRPVLVEELAKIEAARGSLFQHNVRLVAWIAKGFQGKGLDLLDLFQEGAVALLWSIDRFDPAHGTRLSTFASHAVKLGIVRALADKGRMVRIPNYRLREVVEASSARSRLVKRLGREPGLHELESETGLSRESLEELMAAIRPVASIDAPVAGTELYLSDVMYDASSPSPVEQAETAEAAELTARALEKLPERERRIVKLRYGLNGEDERSFEDIGRILGLSRERTRQLEAAARGKLRAMIEAGVARAAGAAR